MSEVYPKKLYDEPIHPFPIDALGGLHREFCETLARSVDHDVAVVAALTLPYLAACYQHGVEILMAEGYTESGSLYLLGAMPSSERKTPIISRLERPLIRYAYGQCERVALAHDAWEARLDELKAGARRAPDQAGEEGEELSAAELKTALRRWSALEPEGGTWFVDSDLTGEGLRQRASENGGSVLISDSEGSRLMDMLGGRYAKDQVEADFLLKAWTGSASRKTRASKKAKDIKRACASMSVLMQPDQLQRLDSRLKEIGLLGRILFVYPKSRLGYQRAETDALPAHLQSWWDSTVSALLIKFDPTLSGSPLDIDDVILGGNDAGGDGTDLVQIRLSPEARAIVTDVHGKVNLLIRPGKAFEPIKEWAGKCQSHLARIATAMSAAENPHGFDSNPISGELMGRAARVFDWFAKEARRVALTLTASSEAAVHKDLAAVSNWVMQRAISGRRHAFTVATVRNARREFKRNEDLQPYLDMLADADWITPAGEGTYEINPHLGKVDLV